MFHYFLGKTLQSWLFFLTLSNSSIRQIPLSASTKAPASRVHSFDTGFLCTYAVKPTADAPWPVVYTTRGAVFSMYFKNCDFAVPGSPHARTLISPRTLCLPPGFLGSPPNIARARARLMSSWPYMEGAMLENIYKSKHTLWNILKQSRHCLLYIIMR